MSAVTDLSGGTVLPVQNGEPGHRQLVRGTLTGTLRSLLPIDA